jgi:hypothetical protein
MSTSKEKVVSRNLQVVVEERSSCSEAEPEGQVERGEVRMLE